MAMTKPKSSQIEHRGESVQKVIDDLTQQEGVLDANPSWEDVPKLKGVGANAQAQALVNRTEIIKSAVLSYPDYVSAEAAAATLPDGQLVQSPDAEGRLVLFDVVGGSLAFSGFIPDAIRLETYNDLRSYSGEYLAVDIVEIAKSGRFNCHGVVEGAVDNGGTQLIDALGRLWEREFYGDVNAEWFGSPQEAITNTSGGRTVRWFSNDNSPTVYLELGWRDTLEGYNRGNVLNGGVNLQGFMSEVKDYTIRQSVPENYCINTKTDEYFQRVNNVRARGNYGLNILGIETFVSDFDVQGYGSEESDGVGINIKGIDTSLHNISIGEVRTGINADSFHDANNVHIVRARTALRLNAKGYYNNLYLDGPKQYGAYFTSAANQSSIDRIIAYRVGRFNPDVSGTNAFFFAADTESIKLGNVSYIQDDPSTMASAVFFAGSSKNNILYNWSGFYKMSAEASERMRKQTCFGMSDGWAKHNNLVRMNRARATGVAPGASATLTFTLDWEFPVVNAQAFFLFKGTWSSRNNYDWVGYGDLYIPIAGATVSADLPPTITKVGGTTGGNIWEIVSTTLSGDVLTVVVKNTGDATAAISAELGRSVDSSGVSF